MLNLIPHRPRLPSAQEVTAQLARVMEEFMQSGQSSEATLNQLGISRQQALEVIAADDEVESCREDLRAAMLAQAWHIYGDGLDEATTDRLWRVVRRHLPMLAEVVLYAKLNGFGVAQYVYVQEADGLIVVDKVIHRAGTIERFAPKPDGQLYYDDQVVDNQLVYLLLVNRPTDKQPAGEMTAARLYPAVRLRKQGFLYAAQFINRYAQPYLIAHTDIRTADDHRRLVDRLHQLISGGAMSLGREDQIELLQNSADGQAFGRLTSLANACIQKLLLGKVRLSDLNSGSYAAQESEDKTRGDRMDGYLYLLTQAVQHLLDAVLMANQAWGKDLAAPKGVWFEFKQEEMIDIKRAQRDKIYLDSGALCLTEQYFRDVLGFDESHFLLNHELNHEPPEPTAEPAARLSVQLSGGGHQRKIQTILDTLSDCNDYAELSARLNQLSFDDEALMQKLVGEACRAWVEGAQA